MQKSMDCHPAKRFKTSSVCSAFECLSGELLLHLFEYFNLREILYSFSDVTPLITSCIYDRRHQLHVYLDRQQSSLSSKFSPDQVLSLHIEHVVVPLGIFVNLKSLFIVFENEWENPCLNMIKEISQLSQLVNCTLSLRSAEVTSITQEIIHSVLCHGSVQRIRLLHHIQSPYLSSDNITPVKLLFPSVKRVYVASDFPGQQTDHLRCQLNKTDSAVFQPQYHVRHLELKFMSRSLRLLAEFLGTLPLLVTLKVEGSACCVPAMSWLYIDIWDEMLQNLKALQQVSIEVFLAVPFSTKQQSVARFNALVAEKEHTCKRINLTAGRGTKPSKTGGVQISASLNMN